MDERIGLLCMQLLAACPAQDSGACENDEQCKGDRLCIAGECQDPQGSAQTSAQTESGTTAVTGSEPTTSPTSTTSGSTTGQEMSTTEPASTTATTSGPEQPYGICRFECATTRDCCVEHDCEGGTSWTCDGGLCRSQCEATECVAIGSVIFGCVMATIDIPGSSFCGATCENTCSEVIDDPAYYCNMDAGYDPEICSFDCGIDGTVCNGSNGTACLPDGTCGCESEGDCAPGYACFKQWR